MKEKLTTKEMEVNPMEENAIKETDEVWGDSFQILIHSEINEENSSQIRKGTLLEFFRSEEYDKPLTFGEAVSIAKENGFTEGIFLLIAETPLEGTIYLYANCYEGEPFWTKYGTTQGYA